MVAKYPSAQWLVHDRCLLCTVRGMDSIEARTQVMDVIAAAGDATVLRFAARCMELIQEREEVTAEDAEDFAQDAGLL